jgi:tRNA threonylcarbamoyladenosine biosynthesis protein TsaB
MNILSIDTTHSEFSIALLKNEVLVSSIYIDSKGKQAEQLVGNIEIALEQGNCSYDDLDAIGINIGPGSFTGVRIGLSAAKGINIVKKIPLIAVTSFESVAKQLPEKDINKNLLVVLDARRDQVFAQFFDNELNQKSEPRVLSYEEILQYFKKDNIILTGNGSNLVKETILKSNYSFKIINDNAISEADSIAIIANEKLKNNQETLSVKPLYIRKPDAKKTNN